MTKSTHEGEIVWRSCYHPSYWSWFDLPPALRLECASINVPVDETKPQGKQFTIPLTRLPSQGKEVIGNLLILNGGPGGHSLDLAEQLGADVYGQTIKNTFHLLGYAPRGIKPAQPFIDCGGRDDESDAKAYMQACIEHTGADILSFVSSKEVVKDLERIRVALGSDTWSMIGYSYGTKLVAKYAEYYPARLRAGVLDGVVDTSEDWFTMLFNQQAQAQIAFDAFMKTCQSPCIFDTNKAPSVAFLEKLKEIEQKQLKDNDKKVIDKKAILKIINENLNQEQYWSDVMAMLEELNQGITTRYNEEKFWLEQGEYGFTKDALAVVNCADSAPKVDKDTYLKAAKKIDSVAQYDDVKVLEEKDYLDACYYWALQGSDNLTENLINDKTPNLLFVSYEHDLATPYANAQAMAERFDDPLVVLLGQRGHTVSLFGENACVDDYVSRYLLEPKTDFKDKLLICGR